MFIIVLASSSVISLLLWSIWGIQTSIIFTELKTGDVLENLHVIKIYEDGKLGLSPRGNRKDELDTLENKILSYLEGSDGYMRFNDKSDPKDISILFNSSKKNFKRALGVLMKKGLIYQDEEGTYLK